MLGSGCLLVGPVGGGLGQGPGDDRDGQEGGDGRQSQTQPLVGAAFPADLFLGGSLFGLGQGGGIVEEVAFRGGQARGASATPLLRVGLAGPAI